MKKKCGFCTFVLCLSVYSYGYTHPHPGPVSHFHLVQGKPEEKSTLSDHLKKLSDRVNRLKGKSKSKVTTVAGLRGEKQKKETTKSKLYWKGKSGEIPQKELAAFEKATDLALAGKTQEAINAFDSFIKSFPKSPLAPDARETLSLLKQP